MVRRKGNPRFKKVRKRGRVYYVLKRRARPRRRVRRRRVRRRTRRRRR